MSWGKEWPVTPWQEPTDQPNRIGIDIPLSATAINKIWQNDQAIAFAKAKLVGDVIITRTTIEDGEIKSEIIPLEKIYNNLSPTHDPYTNPNACIYYECKCGKILDPDTKSFAALNNYASSKGWKIRWKKDGMGYEPFCVECGKDVE